MKTDEETISALANLITGDTRISPYRKGAELVEFFNKLGWNDVCEQGFPTRWNYAHDKLVELNGSSKMERTIIAAVNPRHFISGNKSIEEAVIYLNSFLIYDGYEIIKDGLYYKVNWLGGSVNGNCSQIKNIIFAANGPKPEIILVDATTNEIEIVKNEEYCLVYDRPITGGLRLSEVVEWWRSKVDKKFNSEMEAIKDLYTRLCKPLENSPPEKTLLKTYFSYFCKELNINPPALIPQVYLHYDPYTIKQLKGNKRLERQRMDFLLLFADGARIVIEVDGKQHYSEANTASPKLYSEMVAEDRRLKLTG